jgi:multidrug efflux pump subunit AcrA (membrane-fusion protein)
MPAALGLRLLLVLFAGACPGGGFEQVEEGAALLSEVPKRAKEDGSVELSAADMSTLGLLVETAAVSETHDFAMRFGRVLARQGEHGLVVAPVAGRITEHAAVELGASVEKGALIVSLVPVFAAAERLSASLRGAELAGQIEALEREASAKVAELARAEQLASSQIISDAKLQETQTALATSQAQLSALRRARGIQNRTEGSALSLRTEVSGIVAAIDAPVGAMVSAGAVLARILKPGPLWIDLESLPDEPAFERHDVWIGGAFVPARLLTRGAVISEDGFRHDRLELEQAHAAALLPGASVRVRVGRTIGPGVVVPEAAIVATSSGAFVYIESKPGTYARRAVQVASRYDGKVALSSGVQAGEKVVVRGGQALRGENLRDQLQERD